MIRRTLPASHYRSAVAAQCTVCMPQSRSLERFPVIRFSAQATLSTDGVDKFVKKQNNWRGFVVSGSPVVDASIGGSGNTSPCCRIAEIERLRRNRYGPQDISH